jgi:hypothetical protein
MACHDDPAIAFSIREESRTTIAKASDVQERIVRLIGGLIEASGCSNELRQLPLPCFGPIGPSRPRRNSYRKAGASLGGSVKCLVRADAEVKICLRSIRRDST